MCFTFEDSPHGKSEQLQSSKAEGDQGQKPKAQVKETVKGVGAAEGEHKPKNKVETKPAVVDGEQKSKAQLRAERRAVQVWRYCSSILLLSISFSHIYTKANLQPCEPNPLFHMDTQPSVF